MSRIGKQPIAVPKDLKVTLDKQHVAVKGPKGSLSLTVHPLIKVEMQGDVLNVTPVDASDEGRRLHGLSRTIVANMITGLSKGFKRDLDIEGVGYKAELKGHILSLALGFSHSIEFPIPDGIKIVVDAKKTKLSIEGISKELVGSTAAKVRSFRPPEPYGGKGIRYSDEVIVRKEGKSAGK